MADDTKNDNAATGYSEVFAAMEQGAEERLPGVLDLLEAYGQATTVSTAWRPVNAAALGFGTGTTPERTLR